MDGLPLRESQVLGTLAAVGVCLGGIVLYLAMRKRPTEEELELQRREGLVTTGRIIDGTVIDISDLDAQQSGREQGMQLILYKYEIAGVVYECSQDVTSLKEYVDIYDCKLGFPCSVRYDTHQPANSIVVAEGWSGLRTTANSVPVPPPKRVLARKPRTPSRV